MPAKRHVPTQDGRGQRTAVVALGGNALLRPLQRGTIAEQLANVDAAARHIVQLSRQGYRVIVTHGNGPQVGNLLIQQDRAKDVVPELPLYICVAETQGQIGSMLQEALYNKLHEARLTMPVVTVVTHVLVDPKDRAFRKPTKPVGPFYPHKDFLPRDWTLAKTVDGFQRVVPSPVPREVVEAREIGVIADTALVIACGGGGVPVIKDQGIRGVDAVIDKDLSSARLAAALGADLFVILTNVDNVSLNYRKPDQKSLLRTTAGDLKKYLRRGHFGGGTMAPKVQAAIDFLARNPKGTVVITSLTLLDRALAGTAGTTVTK